VENMTLKMKSGKRSCGAWMKMKLYQRCSNSMTAWLTSKNTLSYLKKRDIHHGMGASDPVSCVRGAAAMVGLISWWFWKKCRDRSEGREVVGSIICLMGDAPFTCLLMSLSLMGHHDQRQESSKKLLKPINDYLPFIVIKVKKVQRILH
jgi:hypothetical protein